MGEVYEAEDRALGTRVAIKTIRPEIAHDPQILARFRREVNLARQVTHPNVCRVYDFAHATRANGAEIDFLTMEYLDGETLSQFLQPRAALTLAEALPLIRQIAEALSAAHRAGVVHRDLKSSNIFLTRHRDGELRVAVTDFGLARSVLPHDGQSLSHSGWGAGTPSYMAPEQLEGKSTGPASDFYSLGVVMYEMATGRSPHAGSSPVEITVRRLKEPLRPPRSLNPAVDPAWDVAIMRCLEPHPADRLSDAPSLLAALGGQSPVPWFPHRRRTWLSKLAIASAAAALLLALGWWLTRPPTLPEAAQRTYTEALNALADGSYLTASRLFEQTVRQQPDYLPATLRLAETYLELDQIRPAQETLLRVADRWIFSYDSRRLRDALRLIVLRDYEAALPILRERQAQLNTTQAQLDFARALERASRLTESAAAYEAVRRRDPSHAGAALRLAAVAGARAERPQAEKYLEQALELYGRYGNFEGQGEAYLVRASLARDMNALDRARAFAERAAARGRETGSQSLELRAQLIDAHLDVLAAKPDDARRKATAATLQARQAGLETLACQGLIDLGIAFLSQVQDKRAEEVHREALAIAERNDAPFHAASARLGLAMDLSGQARGDESLAEARRALAYFEKTSFRAKRLEALRVMGHAYFALSDWPQAARYYGDAARGADQPWESILRRRNLQSQAEAELRFGNFPHVREVAEQLLASRADLPPVTVANTRLTLATVARLLGHYDDAQRLTDSLLQDPALENKGFRQRVMNAQVSLLAARGRTPEALRLAATLDAEASREGRDANQRDTAMRRCLLLAVAADSDVRQALTACRTALSGLASLNSPLTPDVQQALAQAQLLNGDFAAAHQPNQDSLAAYQRSQSLYNVFYGRLLEAAIHQAAGRLSDAEASRGVARQTFHTLVERWPESDRRSYLARPALQQLARQANWAP